MNIKASSSAVSVSIAAIAAMTIIGETSSVFKEGLKALGGHHWVGKGIVAVGIFGIMYLIFSLVLKNTEREEKSLYIPIVTTAISSLVIFFFFLWHFFV